MGNTNSSTSSVRSDDSPTSNKLFKKPLLPSESKNAKLVEEKWCKAFNRHDMRTVKKFATPDSFFRYKGATGGMSLQDFIYEVENICRSFPDNKMRWDSIAEIAPGKVKVTNFVGRGTHTGAPYGFGPFPPIPATGIVVEEDPCHLYISVKNGKMTKFVIDTYCGDLVGPPGYYQKIGGKYNVQPVTPEAPADTAVKAN